IKLVTKGDRKELDWNPVDEQFKDVHIRSVGVYHDDVLGADRGKNSIFILEVDGLRIAHLGDLGHTLTEAQAKRIGPVDGLMVPVAGVYGINADDAQTGVKQLEPKQYILPMHYGTKVYDDVLDEKAFLDGQKPENVKRFDTNELVIDTGNKPAAPLIVLLGW